VLESKARLDLIGSFQTLLALSSFFDRLRLHDFKEAWSIIDKLYLLPSTPDQIQTKLPTVDPVLVPVLDDVLLGAMEALYHQYIHLKHSGVITDSSTVRERLQGLRNRAGLLSSFAARLGIGGDIASRMTRMEAQMV